MENPWRRLRELTDWLLGWAYLPGDLRGLTHHHARVIVLDRRLTQAERRSTLAHELEHADRGPMPANPVLAAREEAAVERAAARRLIDLVLLGDALAVTLDLDAAAEDLWVDRATLETRLRTLHPVERHYLLRRTEHHRE